MKHSHLKINFLRNAGRCALYAAALCVLLCTYSCSSAQKSADISKKSGAQQARSESSSAALTVTRLPSASDLLKEYTAVNLSPFSDSINHARYQYKDHIPPYGIYSNRQIAGISENMILRQNSDGGWDKNVDWAMHLTDAALISLRQRIGTQKGKSTFDNRTVYSHVEYLAHVYQQIPDVRYKDAAVKGVQWMLNAQHPNSGGFTGADVFAVTFNDDVMTGVLRVLRDIAHDSTLYGFLPSDMRERALSAYERGIDCILNCQIYVTQKDGSRLLTAWGQQHSHETLAPVKARTFEPMSITAGESVGVIELLMEIEKPSARVIESVNAACQWLLRSDVVITGKKLVKIPAEALVENGRYSDYETKLIDSPSASRLWARFYDTQTMEPLYYDRDALPRSSFNELCRERRNGYGYVGTWPKNLLEKKYPAWQKRIAELQS